MIFDLLSYTYLFIEELINFSFNDSDLNLFTFAHVTHSCINFYSHVLHRISSNDCMCKFFNSNLRHAIFQNINHFIIYYNNIFYNLLLLFLNSFFHYYCMILKINKYIKIFEVAKIIIGRVKHPLSSPSLNYDYDEESRY